jgi:hypothetical protein
MTVDADAAANDDQVADIAPSIAEAENEPPRKQSRVIASVLAPAVQLWLRSQLAQVEDLQLKIEAGDRQLLTGSIRQVTLSARKAVYQGLHLSQVHLIANTIRVNLGQMLRGKPFQLLEPIPVEGELLLQQEDVNASLQSPLLANAVLEFLITLLKSDNATDLAPEALEPQELNLQNPTILLEAGQLLLSVTLCSKSGEATTVVLRTGLALASPQELQLVDPTWLPHLQAKRGFTLHDLNGFKFDLGAGTSLSELTLTTGQVVCRGRLLVTPA